MATMTQPSDVQADTRTRQYRFCGPGLQRTFVDLGLSPYARPILRLPTSSATSIIILISPIRG